MARLLSAGTRLVVGRAGVRWPPHVLHDLLKGRDLLPFDGLTRLCPNDSLRASIQTPHGASGQRPIWTSHISTYSMIACIDITRAPSGLVMRFPSLIWLIACGSGSR